MTDLGKVLIILGVVLDGGASNINFDCRIAALRKKYESVRFANHSMDMISINRVRKGLQSTHRPFVQLAFSDTSVKKGRW